MSDGGAQAYIFGPFHDSSGNLLTSVKLYHYAAGTTNNKAAWSDEDKATPLASPWVPSSANGAFLAYFDGDYKIRVDDTDDVTLYTWDNFKITSDTATMWEGNFGLTYPAASTSNRWHMFAKVDGSNNFLGLGINEGETFREIIKRHTSTSIINVKDSPYNTAGDGVTNDTAAIQAAVNAFKHTNQISATGARGGTLYFPPGRYLITSPIIITETSCLTIKGSGYGRLQSYAGGSNNDEGSSVIYNNCGVNEAAFLVQPTGSNWKTNFTVFQELGITARSGNPDGIEFDTTNDGMHDIILDRVTILGGNRQIYITGTGELFNFMMYNCLLEQAAQVYSTGRANYGIYCDAQGHSLGIQSLIKDTTIRATQINNIYFDGTGVAGIQFILTLQNCTLEETYDGASIFMKTDTTSKLITIGCHWEQIWKNAFWNGTYLQKSAGDSDAAGILEIGDSTPTNKPISVTMFQPDANTSYNSESDPEKVLPFIVQYSGDLNIFGGYLSPSATSNESKQSPFRFDGFEIGINITGIVVGTLTGVDLIGGSGAASVTGMAQIANNDYLLRKVDLTTNNRTGTVGTGVTATEYGDGHQHVTKLTFTDIAVGNTGGAADKAIGALIYTLPAGVQDYKITYMSVALSTETVAVQTDTPDVGVGSIIASGVVAVLGGTATFEDYLTGQTAADVNGTATVKTLAPTAGPGTAILAAGNAKTVHLNVADGWAAAADVLATGTITIEWTTLN